MYSNNDHYSLILFLKNGKLQLKYHNITSHIIFDSNQIINDGQQYNILISRHKINIDKRMSQILIPLSLLLFFDVITIGGSHHVLYNNQIIACFSNITYNHHSLLPEGIVKSDRYDCFYDQNSICDRQIPCNNIQSSQFCGQMDCSLVCIPPSIDRNTESLLEYSSQIQSTGQYEQIYLTIFTTSGNSTLFIANNASIQVSIILQVSKSFLFN